MEFRLTPGFHGVSFYKTTIIRQLTKLSKSKIEKYSPNRWDFVGIFTCDFQCVCVCVCVCVFVWVLPAHYCLCMFE